MSLLTGRKSRITDPEVPKKAAPAKPGEVYVTKDNTDFGVNARRNMTAEKDERMAKVGYIPEVDASGNKTGAYTVNRNKKPAREVVTKPKPTPEPKGRPSAPVMQADQKKSTGQKQIAKRVWDDEKKQWKMV